jgi:hypothetical protein
MEHQRERQIIEQQHKEAEEAAARLRQQVDAMQPAQEWYGASPEVPLDPSWQVGSVKPGVLVSGGVVCMQCARSVV